MLLVLEGCTASGKSTLMKKMVPQHKDWERAPEHTPPPVRENDSLLDRQEMVFKSFMEHCENLIADTEHIYLADFSPFGCVCFSQALGRWKQDDRFLDQAARFDQECRKHNLNIIAYLSPGPEAIIERLKSRARPGDDVWNPDFLKILCEEYDRYFRTMEINPEFQDEISHLRKEIELEKSGA